MFFNGIKKSLGCTSGSVGLDRVSQAPHSKNKSQNKNYKQGAWTECHRRPIQKGHRGNVQAGSVDRVSQMSDSFLQLHESSQVVLVLVGGARVTVRVGLERVHINHAFREHQAIVLVGGSGGQGVLFGVAVNAVGLSDATSASFGQRVEQFVQRILFQHLVVELSSTFGVESVERKPRTLQTVFPELVWYP